MVDPDTLGRFLKDYLPYKQTALDPTRDQIKSLLAPWRDDPRYWAHYRDSARRPVPSPIQRIRADIKRPESVVDKILRKADLFPDGLSLSSCHRMNDAVRARAIVYFMSQLPLVNCEVRRLEEAGTLEISKESPPTAFLTEEVARRFALNDGFRRVDKESGYLSLHYILRFRESVVPVDHRPWWELQVRTLVEDVWGEIEHILGYKPDKKTTFSVKKRFNIISNELSAIDEHFNLLYEELEHHQESGLVIEDEVPLNAENLAAVLIEVALGCAQKELDGLLKILNSRSLGRVGDLRRLATVRRIETIRHTHLSQTKREASNFEIIAILATLSNAGPEQEEELIRAQIAFLDAWNSSRGGRT